MTGVEDAGLPEALRAVYEATSGQLILAAPVQEFLDRVEFNANGEREAERIHPAAVTELKGKEVRRAKQTAGEVSNPSISQKRENLARLCFGKMNMAFGGNMNIVAGLIGWGSNGTADSRER